MSDVMIDTLTFDNSCRIVGAMGKPQDVLQGTLDVMVLKLLALGPLHGWGISKRLRHLSGDVIQVHQGSLYPALYRLEDEGWISASWGAAENGRRTKVYSITASGKKALAAERSRWRSLSAAVEQVLRAT